MVYPIVELNDADLLAKMRNFEDHFVERKVVKDERDVNPQYWEILKRVLPDLIR
jgi:hypothetical protein